MLAAGGGTVVGAVVGVADGGAAVGAAVGLGVGLCVSLGVGLRVGLRVGLCVGRCVNFRVGFCIGLCVSFCFGFRDSTAYFASTSGLLQGSVNSAGIKTRMILVCDDESAAISTCGACATETIEQRRWRLHSPHPARRLRPLCTSSCAFLSTSPPRHGTMHITAATAAASSANALISAPAGMARDRGEHQQLQVQVMQFASCSSTRFLKGIQPAIAATWLQETATEATN